MTKETYAWTGFGVPLAWLAELDNNPSPNALGDAFGDRYLYRHNPIFAGIRDAALGFGYRFSAEDTPLWRDYQSLSLMALHRILSDKTIPYFNTGTTFARLLDGDPAARLPAGFIAASMKRNYAFHESAHCVAHSILHRIESGLRAVAPGERDRFVLGAILAESFANTVEALGSVFRYKPVSDRVFYRLNSYFSYDQKLQDVLNRVGSEFGAEGRFALMFCSYFEANLAFDEPPESTYQRVAEAGRCLVGQTELVREIADTGFKLSAGFREGTTPAYFELLGYTREYNALANANWLDQVPNQSFFRSLTRLLWKALGKV
jgi:hypothetical protein